jgi:hypothetical protein
MKFTQVLTLFILVACSSCKVKEKSQQKCDEIKARRTSNLLFLANTLNYAPMSYVSPPSCDIGSPRERYFLSADIVPQFAVGGKWIRAPLHITPRFVARLLLDNKNFGDVSMPVRTPSYMPGGTWFLRVFKLTEESHHLFDPSLSFFHHSNGQDGPQYKDGKINEYNGSFSTNFFELAAHYRYRQFFEVDTNPCKDAKPNFNDYYFRIGVEEHVNTEREGVNNYGDHRLNLDATIIHVRNYCDKIPSCKDPLQSSYHRESFRFTANATIIYGNRFDLNPMYTRFNFSLFFHYRIPSSPNASLFLGGGYYGSDPYNIFYRNTYCFLRCGLSLGFFILSDRPDH